MQRVYVAHGDRLSVLLGDAGDPAFARRVKDAIAPVAERRVELGGDPFAPYYFEFATSGILAAATLWYGRGQELEPSEFGRGVRDMLTAMASTRAGAVS